LITTTADANAERSADDDDPATLNALRVLDEVGPQ
jgi:hypothetical protein